MGCTARQFTFFPSISNSQSVFTHTADNHRVFKVKQELKPKLFSPSRNFNLEEALEGVSSQISCEVNKSLTDRSYPALTPALQATLRGQICSITQKDNPIRTLVGKIDWAGVTVCLFELSVELYTLCSHHSTPNNFLFIHRLLLGIFLFDQGLFFLLQNIQNTIQSVYCM